MLLHNKKKKQYFKMSSQYYPPYKSSSNNIKVELDLSNYATKKDINDISHVDVSGFASKTNLAALKTEVDKIDADKLKTVPVDLAKLSNIVKNEVVKKTDYNAKVTNIEGQIAGVTKNTLDNLGDITKLKAVDTSNFVLKTKLASDVTTLENKIDAVDKRIADISGLATKTSLNDYLQTSTFNFKVTEVENKIKDTDIIAKSANTKANTIRSDLTYYAKKTDVANDFTTIKNDYVSNASLTSKLNDLKSQHIATEVTGVDNKTKKNASDILALENKLKQKEDTINENERGLSFNRGFFYYLQQSCLVCECKINSFNFNDGKISEWKSTSNINYSNDSNMRGIEDPKAKLPELKNDERMHVSLFGNYFEQNKVIIPSNNNVINIYCVYELRQVNIPLSIEFTNLNALFGAMEITKNANTSKYKYKGYGICFDKGGSFTEGSINNGRNVLSFGVHESSLLHSNNKANNIYVMGKGFVQGINDTTLYAEKVYSQNFPQPNKKFVLSLHYNDDNSYLFINGKQELKFKCKTDQLVKKKLCIVNLSNNWSPIEAQKTGLYGKIYDFVVDYKVINGVKKIYDLHRYLMTKHDIV